MKNIETAHSLFFTSLEWTGTYPDRAICPICGEEVDVVQMASKGVTYTRKGFSRARGGGKYGGSSPRKGELSCGHEFTYDDIDHEVLNRLKEEFAYVSNIVDYASSPSEVGRVNGEFVAKSSPLKELFVKKVEELLEIDRVPYNYPCNKHEDYAKLHEAFGDMNPTHNAREDAFSSDTEKNNKILYRILSPPNRMEKAYGKELEFSLDEYDSLESYEREHKNYPFYLTRVISKEFSQWDDYWGMMRPPVDFDELQDSTNGEKEFIKSCEFIIQLYRKN